MSNLYKIDTTGKIRILTIEAKDEIVHRTSGVYGGNLITNYKVCKPKNVGKSNETNPEQQAILEAASEINEKIREGYVLISEDVLDSLIHEELEDYIKQHTVSTPDCMLAETFKPAWYKVDELMLASAKLDGMRCMAVITKNDVQLYSRGRLPITTMEHIREELIRLRDIKDFEGILDGELYYHDKNADNFQDIMKACKKYRPGVSELVEYHVYELIDESFNAKERHDILYRLLAEYPYPILTLVKQYPCTSMEDLTIIHEVNLKNGYEGTMLKHGSGMYRPGARSNQLLKFKDFKDHEFRVVDIIPMTNYPDQGLAVCFTEDGKEFRATPAMSHNERKHLLLNKQLFVGKMATIKYFSTTEDGIPRLGSLKSFVE